MTPMPKPQYGREHRARRAAWADELVRTGGRRCYCRGQCGQHAAQCQVWIKPGDKWDLAHGVAHINGGDGSDSEPSCPGCNRAEGSKLQRQPPPASEEWW
jgi:hypothetical protein